MLVYDNNRKTVCIDNYSYDKEFLSSSEICFRNNLSKVLGTPGIKLISLAKYFETFFFNKRDSISEDLIGWYITALKILIRESSAEELSQLYNGKTKQFPILDILMNYSHHRDVMIRNAARLSILIIFKRCHGEVVDYIEKFVIPNHFMSIAPTLKYIIKGFSNQQKDISLKYIYQKYCEELEYFDDMLNLSNIKFNDRIRQIFLETLIIPVLWSIADDNKDKVVRTKSVRISFLLLGTFLNTISDQILQDIICSFFRVGEFSHLEFINNDKSRQCREKIMYTVKHMFSRKHDCSCISSLVVLLTIVVNHYVSNNQYEYLFYTYKSYAKLVFSYLTKEVKGLCNYQNATMDLIVLFLEPMLRENSWSGSTFGVELRKYFIGLILDFYLLLCDKIKIQIDSSIFSLIDTDYKVFLEGKYKQEKYHQTFLDSIEDCCVVENSLTMKQHYLRATLKKFIRLRHLYLFANSRKETILPFLPNKMRIGQTLELGESLPCTKLIHNQTYSNHHYLKLTASHIVVLQNTENISKGIVIFSAYYNDLKFSKLKNNELQLYDYTDYKIFQGSLNSLPLFIQIKFQSLLSFETVIKSICEARQKQRKKLKRKIRRFLTMDF